MSTSSHYTITLLSTHTSDSSPSLLVTFPHTRYLFNAPESISRICLQQKLSLKKVETVFLGNVADSLGLPGLILSAVEAGVKRMRILGPEGTDHYVASNRFFTKREHLHLTTHTLYGQSQPQSQLDQFCLPPPAFQNADLTVYAFPLSREISSKDETDRIISPNLGKRKRSRSSSPTTNVDHRSSPGSPPQLAINSTSAENGANSASNFSNGTAFATSDLPSPSFTPVNLIGQEANEWRQAVIADMFRGARHQTDHENSASTSKPNPYSTRPRSQSPAFLPQSLPPLPNRVKQDSIAMSYLFVGQPIRGKFFPEEAKRRGVKPAQFKKLVSGERVWVAAMAKSAEQAETTEVGDTPPAKKETKKERAKRAQQEREKFEAIVEGEGEGNWVKPEDCNSEQIPPKAFLVVNLPSADYLDKLNLFSPEIVTNLPNSAELNTIFWLLGPEIVHDSRLTEFIASFPKTVSHRICYSDLISNDSLTFAPHGLLTLRLNRLDTKMFPLPKYSFLTPDTESPIPNTNLLFVNQSFNERGEIVNLNTVGKSDTRHFNFQVPSEEAEVEAAKLKGTEKSKATLEAAAKAWSEFVPAAKLARKQVERIEKEKVRKFSPGDDLRVTALGTGSATPSKYRNVSSTLLHLPEQEGGGYILLDAGEGTLGQIARRFGKNLQETDETAERILRDLKLIFISHLHQDHHAGLSAILKARAQLLPAPNDPLLIVGPPGVRIYLHDQQSVAELGLASNKRNDVTIPMGKQIHFIDSSALEPGKTLNSSDWRFGVMQDLYARLRLESLQAVPVLHRCRCWGFVLTSQSGWRVVFSGDTMPCDALVKAGQGATLLIHEATIDDSMPEVALAKGHSTFGQAIEIGARMRARNLLLTHFSARYPKLPPLSTQINQTSPSDSITIPFEPIVATAFDLATLRVDEFWKMGIYRQPMDILLGWDEEDGAPSKAEQLKASIVETDIEITDA